MCGNKKITELFNLKSWDPCILRLFSIQKYIVMSITPKMGTNPAPGSLSMFLRVMVEEEGPWFWGEREKQVTSRIDSKEGKSLMVLQTGVDPT